MPNKDQPIRKIDMRGNKDRGKVGVSVSTPFTNPPSIPTSAAPEDLAIIDSGIQRSTQAPLAYITLEWQIPSTGNPNYYIVEYATASDFSNYQRQRSDETTAIIQNLKVGITYYFRVQSVNGSRFSDWSNTVSDTTPSDNTAPANVSSPNAVFHNSDLIITWNKPLSETYKDAQIVIKSGDGLITYDTFYSGSEQLVWKAEQNLAATSNIGATDVDVIIKSRSWNNVLATGVTVEASAPVPDAPTSIVSNWIGDTGVADEDLTLQWSPVINADMYRLNIDLVDYFTRDIRYIYRYEQNIQDHIALVPSGVASFTVNVYARDKLNQESSAGSVIVSNIAPDDTMFSLETYAGFSSIYAHVTPNQIIEDFDHWVWLLSDGITTLETVITTTPNYTFNIPASGIYDIGVKAVDKFNQESALVVSYDNVIDTLTIEQLRASAIYSDDNGNSNTTLAVLKDNNLAGSSISYPTGSWYYTQVERPLVDRYGIVTISASANTIMFIATSTDGSTWKWYAGPITTNNVMVEQANITDAQFNYIEPADFTVANRLEIPSIVEARFIRLYHKSVDASAHSLYEYYPRRLIESDDIRAESIKAINIAAGAINADHISTLDLDATHYITAGGGNVLLDNDGITISVANSATYDNTKSVSWKSGSTLSTLIQGWRSITKNALEIRAVSDTRKGKITLAAESSGAGTGANVFLEGNDGISSSITLDATNNYIYGATLIQGASFTVSSPTTVNDTATFKITDTGTNNLTSNLTLDHVSSNTPTTGFGTALTFRGDSSNHTLRNQAQIYGDWNVATDASRQGRLRLNVTDSSGARTGISMVANGSAVQLGFYGGTPVSKQTVTGTRTGTLAQLQTVVANLLTALANEGLITDSTT